MTSARIGNDGQIASGFGAAGKVGQFVAYGNRRVRFGRRQCWQPVKGSGRQITHRHAAIAARLDRFFAHFEDDGIVKDGRRGPARERCPSAARFLRLVAVVNQAEGNVGYYADTFHIQVAVRTGEYGADSKGSLRIDSHIAICIAEHLDPERMRVGDARNVRSRTDDAPVRDAADPLGGDGLRRYGFSDWEKLQTQIQREGIGSHGGADGAYAADGRSELTVGRRCRAG